MNKQEYLDTIMAQIKGLSYDMMTGCEDFNEFNYLRAMSLAVLTFIETSLIAGLRIDWVKLYDLVDSNTPDSLDPKLISAMDDYKIAIMEIFDTDSKD